MLIPSYPIYILPHSKFQYQIAWIYQGSNSQTTTKLVNLPNPEFKFTLNKGDPGKVYNTALVESLDKLGILSLLATDSTLETNSAEGIIHVVAPDKLDMEIIDVTHFENWKIKEMYLDEKEEIATKDERNYVFRDKWVLVEKWKYVVKLHLFDSHGHWIRLTEGMNFDMNLDSTYFKQIDKSSTGMPIYLVETVKTTTPET